MIEGLAASRHVQVVSLRNTHLNTIDCIKIIKGLPKGIEDLDLSYNSALGFEVYELIANMLDEGTKLKSLKSLQFEASKMDDKMLETLCTGFEYNTTIKFINIRRNLFSEKSAFVLKNLIIKNGSVEVLFASWNNFGTMGGAFIATGIHLNSSIKVMDLSFCNFGCAEEFENPSKKKKPINQLEKEMLQPKSPKSPNK